MRYNAPRVRERAWSVGPSRFTIIFTMNFKPTAARAALTLVDPHLPALITDSDGSLEDWQVAAPALVGRAATTLRSIFRLEPPDGLIDATVLTRSLTETAITFAWLATDPDTRRREWRTGLAEERLKLHNRITRTLGNDPRYRRDVRKRFRGGVLDQKNVAREQAYRDSGVHVGGLLDRAIAADQVWRKQISALDAEPFALIYAIVYSDYSFSSHASIQGGFTLVDETSEGPRVGRSVARPGEDGPYGIALLLFLLMLVVSAKTLGWPAEADVYAVLQTA